MLELKDFYHLPELDTCIDQLATEETGLIVVAGQDPVGHLAPSAATEFLPSGRHTIFRILLRQILVANPIAQAIVVSETRDSIRLPRQLERRVARFPVQPPDTYATEIAAAVARRPGLLVVEQLTPENAVAVAAAAHSGLRVLTQMETVFRGADVAWALQEMGAPREQIDALRWVVAVQRLATLCATCKTEATIEPAQLAALARQQLASPQDLAGKFYRSTGCETCGHTGRHGDVIAFDVFRCATNAAGQIEQQHLLPLVTYAFRLATTGHLSLDDALNLEAEQLRRTHRLLSASERALREANTALERRVAELEAAHRVLVQRTEELGSLHGIGQALIGAASLDDLALRICQQTRKVCGADRAILYYLRTPDTAEVLGFSGWDAARVPKSVPAALVVDSAGAAGSQPQPFDDWPPGLPPRIADLEGASLRAGRRVSLTVQDRLVGVMIIHSTKNASFTQRQESLLQTLAYQATLALQRAGLIEDLQDKIRQLEAAQAELITKERLERELELARQVQQSVLPKAFPPVPGLRFAAWNEPARQVGGDFYDIFVLDDDHIGLVIGDVSDKGMPAALYMGLTRSLLLAEARRERSPRAVLVSVNQLLQALGQANMFVTVFYAVLQRSTRRLTYARAGHDRPLLLRTGRVEELAGRGAFLGMLTEEQLRLTEERLELAPGDRLVLFTDGLVDVLTPDGAALGNDRLEQLLQSHAEALATDFCAQVAADLAAYQAGADQYDDMTMLVMDVLD